MGALNYIISNYTNYAYFAGHPKVVAFITHSGMLSTSEALHCGIPIVGIPLFGEQYSNAQSAVESGLGVSVDVLTLNQHVLEDGLNTVLQEK